MHNRERSARPGNGSAGLFVSLDGRYDVVRAVGRKLSDSGELVSLSDLFSRRTRHLDRRPTFLAAFGSPPEKEIGYALLTLAAMAVRAKQVILVDTSRPRARALPLGRHLIDSALPAASSLLASGAALIGQRVAAKWLLRRRPVSTRRGPNELSRLIYLRTRAGYATEVGGSVTHTLEVVSALSSEGVDVECLTTDATLAGSAAKAASSPRWQVSGSPAIFSAVPASFVFAGDLALTRASLRSTLRAGAIYQRFARFSIAGALIARLSGRPLFLEYNSPGNFLASDPAPFIRQRELCEEAVLHMAAIILVVSEVGRDQLVERGVDAKKIVVNPNGVDVQRFAVRRALATRNELSFADDDIVIGFTGSFLPFHGVPVLARSFAKVQQDVPRARLLLVGDGEGRDEVERILTEAGCGEAVRMLGAVGRERIPALLAACDVLASPHVAFSSGASFFGSPTKLFEYMAAGKAIVASRLGQIEDVQGNVDELAAAISRLIADPDLRARLGPAAQKEAMARHTWAHNARRVQAAYENLPLRTR
jgi:glycosyltransferase involved in cell wall biosynthesis